MPRLPFAALTVAAVLASPAVAQPSKKGIEPAKPNPAPAAAPAQPTSAPAATPADPAPLKGPSATTPDAKPSLVRRDFSGKIIRLDMQPAEAAVQLLNLGEPDRAKVDAILLDRSKILDQIVTDNLELLVKLQGARESGNAQLLAQLTRDLADKAAPLAKRGPLATELMGVLPKAQGDELKRLVQEYFKAIVDEDLAKPASEREPSDMSAPARDNGPDSRARAMRNEVLAMTGVEIKRAYDRTIGSQARDFDQMIRDLNLTPEQESKVRQLVGESFQKTYGKATPQERSRVFWKVYEVLDPAQKQALIAKISPKHAAPAAK